MTRKDFVRFAEALRAQMPDTANTRAYDQWTDDCDAVASVLREGNSRFDVARFLVACRVPEAGS